MTPMPCIVAGGIICISPTYSCARYILTYLLTQNCFYLLTSLYIFATEHGYNAFFVSNTINFVTSSLNKHSKMQFCICLGHLGFYPEFNLLPSFTQVLPRFYPGFTQLPRVKLGKTVQRFYPPTLTVTGGHGASIADYADVLVLKILLIKLHPRTIKMGIKAASQDT